MSTIIIITVCILLLFGYVFDITSSKTKLPSVILLLILGWMVKQLTILFQIHIPDLNSILPAIGTVGLILIVLEGSLELDLNRTKLPVIRKSSLLAILSLLLISFLLAFAFYYFEPTSFKSALANAIPFAIISSAIAIPSARNLSENRKEFVTYESSLSDIFGVIFFNFIVLNEKIDGYTFFEFFIQLLLLIVISFVSSIALAFLLGKIKHHVKFVPIILLIILIYSISKFYHLPSLVFILLFGLFIGNLKQLTTIKLIDKFQPEILIREVQKFKELTTEITFMIRTLFFLLFGYLIDTSTLLEGNTISWAVSITGAIFIIRFIILKILNIPSSHILFLAPRGLITILLFLSIPMEESLQIANKSLIIQVIILSSLVMMLGLFKTEKVSKIPE